MKRHHRRTIFKVLLLLAAGATLNVAVAWGCARFVQRHSYLPPPLTTQVGWITASVKRSHQFGHTHLVFDGYKERWHQFASFAESEAAFSNLLSPWEFRQLQRHWAQHKNWLTSQDYPVVHMYGWPVRSLSCRYFVDDSPTARGVWYTDFAHDGWEYITTNVGGTLDFAFPLHVIWPGFAINTLFYAGVLWMLFVGPFVLRRMIRRRRGRCPACAYPIGQSPVCTECGAAVMVKS